MRVAKIRHKDTVAVGMRLHDTLRKGIELDGEQAHGTWFKTDDEGKIVQACALATCFIGAGLVDAEGTYPTGVPMEEARIKLLERFPILDRYVEHPETGFKSPLFDTIVNLNDTYKWSREKIADWISGIPRWRRPQVQQGQAAAGEVTEGGEVTKTAVDVPPNE